MDDGGRVMFDAVYCDLRIVFEENWILSEDDVYFIRLEYQEEHKPRLLKTDGIWENPKWVDRPRLPLFD